MLAARLYRFGEHEIDDREERERDRPADDAPGEKGASERGIVARLGAALHVDFERDENREPHDSAADRNPERIARPCGLPRGDFEVGGQREPAGNDRRSENQGKDDIGEENLANGKTPQPLVAGTERARRPDSGYDEVPEPENAGYDVEAFENRHGSRFGALGVKSALVVGAGFAGLSAALHLARAGVAVEVLEAADRPGGRAQAWSSGGYRFDLGPTLVVMTDLLEEVLGADRFAALELMRLEPGYEVRWPDGERFAVHSDIALSLAEFERMEPGVTPRALDYFARVHGAYRDARKEVLERDRSLLSFAGLLARPGRMRPWIAGSLRRFTERFFHRQRLVEALTFQSLYLGTSPLRAPAIYALLPVVEAIEGVWFAPGGMASIVDAFVEAAQSCGVRFSYERRVERIERRADGSWSASTAERSYEADAVVIAADREPSLALLGAQPPRFRAMRYGHSALCIYLGVRRQVDLPYHSVLLPDDPWRAYTQLDGGSLPDDPLLYAYNPVARDASAAPADGSALLVLAPVPNLTALREAELAAFRTRIFARLEREVGELREFIEVERVRGPAEWASELGLMHGAAFGPDHGLDQMGPFRPPIVDRRFPGLAFAGSGTRPGSGVPMVILSGRLAAEHLLQR